MSFRKKSLSTLVSILFVTLCGCNEESSFETVEIATNPIFYEDVRNIKPLPMDGYSRTCYCSLKVA